MSQRNKSSVQLILVGMVVLNLTLLAALLLPTQEARSAALASGSIAGNAAPLSFMERLRGWDQAMRAFWISLLPFWRR